MNKNTLKAITYTAFTATIAACTSGSGSSNSSAPPVAPPPVAPYTATYLAPPEGATPTTGPGYYSKSQEMNKYIVYAPNGGGSYNKIESIIFMSDPVYISTYAYENPSNESFPYIQYTWKSASGVTAIFNRIKSRFGGLFSNANESNYFVKLNINDNAALYTTQGNNILYNNKGLTIESTIVPPCGDHGGITSFAGAQLPNISNGILGLGYTDGYLCIVELQNNTNLYNVYATAVSQGYTPSSPITGIAFGQNPNTGNGYGYWITSEYIFAFETSIANITCDSGCTFTNLSNLPYAPSNPTSIVVDTLNNLYVGTGNGTVYILQNSSNSSWGAIQLTTNGTNDTSAVNSLAKATEGIVATTVAGNVYNINPN